MMPHLRAALARLAGFFTGHRADDDPRDELLAHVDMQTAEHIRHGVHPDEACRRASLDSGGLAQAAESVREQRGLPWLESTTKGCADMAVALERCRSSIIR